MLFDVDVQESSLEEKLSAIRKMMMNGMTNNSSAEPVPNEEVLDLGAAAKIIENDNAEAKQSSVVPATAPVNQAASADSVKPASTTTPAPAAAPEPTPAPEKKDDMLADLDNIVASKKEEITKPDVTIDAVKKPEAPSKPEMVSPAKDSNAAASLSTLEVAEVTLESKNQIEMLAQSLEASVQSEAINKLISSETAAQTKSTIKDLVRKVDQKQRDSVPLRSGGTLDDLVLEAIKPYLAEWLEKNLPIIVKQVVENEIRRLLPDHEI